ncbi:YkvA family protein [Aureimonas fodinaquatilis]|uniref:YkvA family protein n=1 Tax=Aureimonas fodinaquatilis TaxID=2565783 RepID=UPI001FE39876|nr:YkvA family protein [Aureimonas fodinaquatilis]
MPARISEILRPAPPHERVGQEQKVRRSFFATLKRSAGAIPFTEDLVACYYCALDPKTPVAARGILLAALAYFVMPLDMVSDFLPFIGFTDDAAVLLAALGAVKANLKPTHYRKARHFLKSNADDVKSPSI